MSLIKKKKKKKENKAKKLGPTRVPRQQRHDEIAYVWEMGIDELLPALGDYGSEIA